MRVATRPIIVLTLASTSVAWGQCTHAWQGYPPPYIDAPINSLDTWDPDGPGALEPLLLAGGNLQAAGTTRIDFIGAWDGVSWARLGGGVSGTVDVVWAPDGTQGMQWLPAVGGYFSQANGVTVNKIAILKSGAWQNMMGGAGAISGFPVVQAIQAFDSYLVVAGAFHSMGGIPAQGIARWDGAGWQSFPDDRAGWADCLPILGGELFAGGDFAVPGQTHRAGVLRWDGQQWQNVGFNYPSPRVFAICEFNGRVYAGGWFDGPGNPAEYIAVFDGNIWSTVGNGLNGYVYALQVFDPDGPGPLPETLIAAGTFTTAGGQPASRIASWNGQSWSPLGSGVNGKVSSLTVWRGRLAAAGEFTVAGGITSPGLAFWGCPQPEPCPANCDGSTAAPTLNIADFSCFLQRFAQGCDALWPCYANCDDSTVTPYLNVADFMCFLHRFASGCP